MSFVSSFPSPVRIVLGALAVAAALSFASPSHADAANASDPTHSDVTRLLAAGHSMKWNHVPQGKGKRYGHAEVLVSASPERLMQIVTAYGQYKELVPDKFKVSRVIARDAAGTDLYVQVPLKGPLPLVLISTLRFANPTRPSPTTQMVEGQFVRGTFVHDADIIWTVTRVSDEVSLLKLDLLILPTIPATQGMIDEELRDAAMLAIDAIHDKAQGNNLAVTALASK